MNLSYVTSTNKPPYVVDEFLFSIWDLLLQPKEWSVNIDWWENEVNLEVIYLCWNIIPIKRQPLWARIRSLFGRELANLAFWNNWTVLGQHVPEWPGKVKCPEWPRQVKCSSMAQKGPKLPKCSASTEVLNWGLAEMVLILHKSPHFFIFPIYDTGWFC